MKVCPNCGSNRGTICKEIFARKISIYDVHQDKDDATFILHKSWWDRKKEDDEALETHFSCGSCGYRYDGNYEEYVLEEMDDI